MDELLDSAPCGFLSFADDGTILQVNATLSDWLGYQPNELSGRSLDSILSIGGRIFHQTHIFPGRVSEVMLREHQPSNRFSLGYEDQKENLSQVWRKPHQKEWHNFSRQATLSL